ncbi:putative HTH-type transcriptional regulator YybR [Aliiroseovarius sp. xm-m-379]|uniref:winged helix-turn-helix transcriptional regulator n=1 Tax=Aliiroseovarius TaxID=1658781 RepID=UPI001568CDB7|nr:MULTISPECIES: helix-turn-helix domain-containing protein [Aliiroseovarius]NRP13908.1 putative HTH-type transcriptional regulator YybR [Aliiroseovarius sp. xm-d-517]NRP25447.1 putative HTH-type transcriptional regulator YybR [Aliiroseovarius sp. xm-m-379]NRP29439.1 putative HTH-type transcriptional regulator YybR [Aliiroseovarius sp. xm-m-314]NRP34246.1 putative HTH-type transcriptional regulator YybR [Aliiroseovarius sp. xm-a-104]NRP41795.1 putative HTH-type transcriptional regulator YybR [
MKRAKPYAQTCPISRALDVIGNRWGIHVLRELHAGPTSFGEIKAGLPGIATNMLSSRLSELVEAGLVHKAGRSYRLTPEGTATRGILFELARFGRTLPMPDIPSDPENSRHRAVPLAGAIERIATPQTSLRAELVIDGEPFSLIVADGHVSLEVGPLPLPPVRLRFDWGDVDKVADDMGRFAEFAEAQGIEAQDPAEVAALLDLLQKAIDSLAGHR